MMVILSRYYFDITTIINVATVIKDAQYITSQTHPQVSDQWIIYLQWLHESPPV